MIFRPVLAITFVHAYTVKLVNSSAFIQPMSQLLRTAQGVPGDNDMLLVSSLLPNALSDRVARPASDRDETKKRFCDNEKVELVPDGVVVNILMRPFALVCVIVDLLTEGHFSSYLEEGVLNLHLDDGHGLLNGVMIPHVHKKIPVVSLQEALATPTSPTLSPFATAYLHSLLMTSYTSDAASIRNEIANRLSILPQYASESEVISVVLNFDDILSHTQIPEAVNNRLKTFPVSYREALKDADPLKAVEELADHILPPDFNMRDTNGHYTVPKAFYVFPDKATRSSHSYLSMRDAEQVDDVSTLTHFSQIVQKMNLPRNVANRSGDEKSEVEV